jgi:hypothetical protein
MKIKIWPDDATAVEMDDWLAELREDGRADRAEPGAERTEPGAERTEAGAERTEPGADRAEAGAERTEPASDGVRTEAQSPPAAPAAPATTLAASAAPPASAESVASATGRAVIGDQLRIPITWCEMGSCISRHADPAALGEGDQRARAIGIGWRIDAFGRLACPQCQQTDPGFRATHPVVPWDRYTAMARAARIAADRGEGRGTVRTASWPAGNM